VFVIDGQINLGNYAFGGSDVMVYRYFPITSFTSKENAQKMLKNVKKKNPKYTFRLSANANKTKYRVEMRGNV